MLAQADTQAMRIASGVPCLPKPVLRQGQTRELRRSCRHGRLRAPMPAPLLILKVLYKPAATMRVPPNNKMRSPILNSPSLAWSARNDSRVFGVAAPHIGPEGRNVAGIPTTGITPALASVTTAFNISPKSMRRTPTRTKDERIARSTSQRIAHDSHSQTAGNCVQAR
jgi:hypothetical protein